VLNTILYNWNEEIKDEVTKRPTKTSATSMTAATIITSKRHSIRDNVDTVAPNNDALFDRKIDLITQGIDSFYVSLLKELSQDNALTIVNYILKIFESHTVLVCQGKLLVFAIHLCTMTSSDEETLNSVIPDIMSLIRKNWKDKSNPLFSELRLLIITPSQWLRVFNGDMKLHHEVIEFASIEQLGKRPYIRGDILAFFSRLEGLVREIIQARILGLFLFSAKAEEFDQILQKVGFNNSIRLLVEWGVIKGSLQNKIDKLNGIRNKLAHSWDERDVYYDRKTGVRILDNIVEFRKDAKEVWLELIKVYMKAEVKDIGNLMVKLGDYNTINVWNDIIKERKSEGYTDEE
jgi:hypothetical protein